MTSLTYMKSIRLDLQTTLLVGHLQPVLVITMAIGWILGNVIMNCLYCVRKEHNIHWGTIWVRGRAHPHHFQVGECSVYVFPFVPFVNKFLLLIFQFCLNERQWKVWQNANIYFGQIHVYRVGQKTWHFTFVHNFANYWSIFEIFHWHTLQTICNSVIITYFTTVNVSLQYLVKYHYAYIMRITNILVKLKKKHFRPTVQWMVCMTLNCVGLTQFSVIRIIHCNVGLKCYLLLTLVFAYSYISQGSVETHLPCDRIYNNHIIANCLQSAPLKNFWKSVNNRRRYWQKCHVFMAHGVLNHFHFRGLSS